MRQFKYSVQGNNGKIQLSKGAYLCLIRESKQKKLGKAKKIFLNRTMATKLNKIIKSKIVKSKVKIENNLKRISCLNKQKQHNIICHRSPSRFEKSVDKMCTQTADSEQDLDLERQNIEIPDFDIFNEDNQQRIVKEALQPQNQYRQKGESPCISRISKFPSFYQGQSQMDSTQVKDKYKIENQHFSYEMQPQEESTWSIINSNVQNMSLCLSLSVYDRLNSYKNKSS